MNGVTCAACQRHIRAGGSAWVEDWTVITPEGPRREVRYTCDGCNTTDNERK